MYFEDYVNCLMKWPGVMRFETLTQNVIDHVMDLEYSPRNIGFTPVDPRGMKEVTDMTSTMVLFCNSDFPMFTQPCMDILDENGRLIGFDIMDQDRHIFNSKNFIWLTKNLFVDTSQLDTRGSLTTVIHSVRMNVPGVPDEVKSRVYYPCMNTARYLNDYFKIKNRVLSTVILGVDLNQPS